MCKSHGTGLRFTVIIIFFSTKRNPLTIAKSVSWQILPLVGGLFVIVEGLSKTDLTQLIAAFLMQHTEINVTSATW
ncbi:MAG: hypothetical protein EOP48_25920 [Sphingobacteriales bacterium]|nr:MAG: hypothetical protein EOP48_25920 [Sphingobacteriales bacterium]